MFGLFKFPAGGNGELSIEANEHVIVIKEDNGDGWTLVQNNEGEKGCVPTTFMAYLPSKYIYLSTGTGTFVFFVK